jgi:hypothetical protein
VLPVQGPPGAGKTFTGARMIVDLVKAGRKVGITALSHKVIGNLVEATLKAAREANEPLTCVQKVNGASDDETPGLIEATTNAEVDQALANGEARVAAGTPWLWARPELFQQVDVLVVDEAGQMALANVLAVAQAARSVVLIGDPRQLEQPQKAAHPDGTDLSALDHLLAGHTTVPPDRGLFLERTWRLHPSICALTSELFYESRLESEPGLERQQLHVARPPLSSGLHFVPVTHQGNQNASTEEAEATGRLVRGWLARAPPGPTATATATPCASSTSWSSPPTTPTSPPSPSTSPRARASAPSTSSRARRRRSSSTRWPPRRPRTRPAASTSSTA